jgi:hypothetical protein
MRFFVLILTLLLTACGLPDDIDSSNAGVKPDTRINVANSSYLAVLQTAIHPADFDSARGSRALKFTDTPFNLVKLDTEGNWEPVIDSNLPLNVAFMAPMDDEHLLLGLSYRIFDGYGQSPFSQFVGANNCALFVVTMATGDYVCLVKGLFVKELVSNTNTGFDKPKPRVKFQDNIFYAIGQRFQSLCMRHVTSDPNSNCLEYRIDFRNTETQQYEQERLYRWDIAEQQLTTITQDNEYVYSFDVLATGEIIYYATQRDEAAKLKLWDDGQLSAVPVDAPTFSSYFVDQHNTIIINGTELIQPRGKGGFNRATLSTDNFEFPFFTSLRIRYASPTNSGELYGISTLVGNKNDGLVSHAYRLFPFSAQPIATLGESGARGVEFINNQLIHVERVDNPNYGEFDVIKFHDIETGEMISLLDVTTEELDNGAAYYDIHQWTVVGNVFVFSALEQQSNQIKIGKITVPAKGVTANDLTPEFTALLSANNASNKILQLQAIDQLHKAAPKENAFTYEDFLFDRANPASASLLFSGAVDLNDIYDQLALEDEAANSIPYLAFALGNYIHLVADATGFEADGVTEPLPGNANYSLTLSENLQDRRGKSIADASSNQFPLTIEFDTIAPSQP